jgi:2-furoyl-CoA dehydrogenase FAD binding subunit
VKPTPFDYLRPDNLAEALSALAEYGTDARLIAGGQSLGAMLNMRLVTPKVLIDINGLSELAGTNLTGATFTAGALLRQADALADPQLRALVPLLAQALPHVGHYQTRNRGTVGGSIAHADPSAEISLCLATLGGEVELRSKRHRRKLPATQFFQSALVTAREPDEMVTNLIWPMRSEHQRCAFVEFSVRDGDYAIVAAACVLDPAGGGSLRLGFGGCGETPQVVILDMPAIIDAKTIESIAADSAGKIECQSDLMASSAYRRQLARVLAGRVMTAVCGDEAAHV